MVLSCNTRASISENFSFCYLNPKVLLKSLMICCSYSYKSIISCSSFTYEYEGSTFIIRITIYVYLCVWPCLCTRKLGTTGLFNISLCLSFKCPFDKVCDSHFCFMCLPDWLPMCHHIYFNKNLFGLAKQEIGSQPTQ